MDYCGLPLIISEGKKQLLKETENCRPECSLTNGAIAAAALPSISNSRWLCMVVV